MESQRGRTVRPSVLTVRVSGTYGGYPTWAVAQYAATERRADGVPTWRLVRDVEDCHRGYVTAKKRMREIAEQRGLPYCLGIRHGQEVQSIQM